MNLPSFKFANQSNPSSLPTSNLIALTKLQKIILNSLDFNEVVKKSVNTVLDELGYLNLGYKIIVLALLNESKGVLERIAISQTEEADKALAASPVPFKQILIPLTESDNLSIKALHTGNIYVTNDWFDILRPIYGEDEAKKIQDIVGIGSSMVYPIFARGKAVGTLIFSINKPYTQVTEDEKSLLGGFTDLVGLAVQNSLLFSSLQVTTHQLQSANMKLKELDILKDDFVSVASHELRTPMTAVKSYLWMALNRSDIPLSDKLKKYIDRAYISTERLINLVNDMLNVSRIESGSIAVNPTVFNLQTFAEEIIAEVAPKADEKGIRIFISKSNIPEVFADVDKVHQVILNLLGNAIKFTPNSGSVVISFQTDGVMVETSVKDSGVGINRDDLSRLFQKFGRLDNSYVAAATSGGTGLGLFICKNLVELMRGKIWAESDGIGKGTKFAFSLPVATPEILKNRAKYVQSPRGEVKGLEPVTF